MAAVLVGLLAAACASPAPTATPLAELPGPTPFPTPTREPSPLLPTPSETPAPPTETPQPTATAPCTNDAQFLTDVTVPDGTQFRPGDPIDKLWTVQNIGTCDWGPDYRLVLRSGNPMGGPQEMALYPAVSGAVAPLRIRMTAPAEPGEHIGRWQPRAPDGTLFGAVVFIKIVVVPPEATATPVP